MNKKKNMKPLHELNLTDRFLFAEVMEDPRTHQDVLSIEKTGVKYMQAWEERYFDKQESREEGLAEGRAEGRAEGIEAFLELCREFGLTDDEMSLKLQEKFDLTQEQAQELLFTPFRQHS